MELLIIASNYFLWALITLISGLIGGYGIAAGFDGYKRTKDWFKNKNHIVNSEVEMLAASQEV